MKLLSILRDFRHNSHQNAAAADHELGNAITAFRHTRQHLDARMLMNPQALRGVIASTEGGVKGLQPILDSVRYRLFDKLVMGEAVGFSAEKNKPAPHIIYFSVKDKDDTGFFYPVTTIADEVLGFADRTPILRTEQDKQDLCLFLEKMQAALTDLDDKEYTAKLEDMHPLHSRRQLTGYLDLMGKFPPG